jgi:drug/metabolite transporter (DMT)-like permease
VTWAVFAAAATSALLHACWNVLARRHSTPADVLSGIAIATASLCAVAFPFIGSPETQAWPWIGAASVCNVLYLRTLGRAYEHSDFCAVYAIVRAIVPAILFATGWFVFSEPGRFGPFLGLVVVAGSILTFALPGADIRRLDPTTLLHSVFAGLLLALALFFDVKGIRAGGEGLANLVRYAVASSLATATCIAVLSLLKRTNPLAILLDNGSRCYPGAILLLCSYVCGMWAYAQGPIGLVAPVRESSILFGGILAILVLKQHVTRAQWMAMLLATVGMIFIQVG